MPPVCVDLEVGSLFLPREFLGRFVTFLFVSTAEEGGSIIWWAEVRDVSTHLKMPKTVP